jgi:hypothetical protein
MVVLGGPTLKSRLYITSLMQQKHFIKILDLGDLMSKDIHSLPSTAGRYPCIWHWHRAEIRRRQDKHRISFATSELRKPERNFYSPQPGLLLRRNSLPLSRRRDADWTRTVTGDLGLDTTHRGHLKTWVEVLSSDMHNQFWFTTQEFESARTIETGISTCLRTNV